MKYEAEESQAGQSLEAEILQAIGMAFRMTMGRVSGGSGDPPRQEA